MSIIADYLFGDCPTLCGRIRPGWQSYPRSREQRDLPEPLRRRVRMEEADDLFIHLSTSRDRKHRGDLLGGVSTLQETDLTGPIPIYKLVP